MRTKGGALVPVTSGDQRFTTTELLAAEERIVETATKLTKAGLGKVGRVLASEVVDRHPTSTGNRRRGGEAPHLGQRDRSGHRPGRHRQVDHAACRPAGWEAAA